jgi:hypothetical protein
MPKKQFLQRYNYRPKPLLVLLICSMSGEVSFFEVDKCIDSPIILEECLTPPQNKLFRDTINKYHSYVKYKDSPTRNIRWLIRATESGDLIGVTGLSSATIAVKVRDDYIGWGNETKMRHLCQVANNSRFCIIPDHQRKLKNVGSMILKQLRIVGATRWKEKYGDDLLLLETFVLPERAKDYRGFEIRKGSVYLADNWIYVGETSGHHIRKTPLKLWQRENSERGRMARENPKKCLKLFAGYLGDCNESGYKITPTAKKIMFIKPLVWNYKERLLS